MLNVDQLEVLGNDELTGIVGGDGLTPEQQAIILAAQIGSYAIPGNPVLTNQITTAQTTANLLNAPTLFGPLFYAVTPRPLPPQEPKP
jgi:hypothetical protein